MTLKNGLLTAALMLAAGAVLYGSRSFLKPPPAAPGLSSAPVEAPVPLPPNLPPLGQSDEFVRLRAAGLSPAPALKEWLKLEALISRLSAAMNLIANGTVPRETFAAFAPRGRFPVIRKGGHIFIDPAGFARYDAFAAMVAGVDASAAAKLLTEFLPLFDAAQRELGAKNTDSRAVFLAAAQELIAAPLPDGEAVLKEGKKGVGWIYAADRLEELSPAQKQLMRMGPKNQAAVQAKLRALTLALSDSP